MRHVILTIAALSLGVVLLGCNSSLSGQSPSAAANSTAVVAETPEIVASTENTISTSIPASSNGAFTIASDGISDGVIGDAYGARGEQTISGIPSRSLPLAIQNAPEGTACLALTMIDPDGGNWVHWLAVNLAAQSLSENASIDAADQIMQGRNDFGFTGYGGPTPPSGTHTYVITIYALSESLSLENGFSLKQFNQVVEGKILGTATLTGDYSH